jgi:hypothetical protein
MFKKFNLSHDLREALKTNPYKMVETTFEAALEDKKAILLVNEYVWDKSRYNYCKLMAIEVSF